MTDNRTVEEYLAQLASDAPTPGGGSVAGLVAALAAGLGSMVCMLTKEPANREASAALAKATTELAAARTAALAFSHDDEQAYAAYIAATHLPKATREDKAVRREAVQAALRSAAEVPLQLAVHCAGLLASLRPVVVHGNPHLRSDTRIAVMLAETAHRAALVNVRVNLALMKDADLAEQLETTAQASERQRDSSVAELERLLETRS